MLRADWPSRIVLSPEAELQVRIAPEHVVLVPGETP